MTIDNYDFTDESVITDEHFVTMQYASLRLVTRYGFPSFAGMLSFLGSVLQGGRADGIVNIETPGKKSAHLPTFIQAAGHGWGADE